MFVRAGIQSDGGLIRPEIFNHESVSASAYLLQK